MIRKKNVLWIMADQLRWDYLSCYGHPTLKTPNIDALAARGLKFDCAYVQSPICGPSRMSFYTGRYVRSHGSTWNGFPLRVGEPTLSDHLRNIGVRSVLVGKTHMIPDVKGMEWLGIAPDSPIGITVSECGFEPFERDDGLHPIGYDDANVNYNAYLGEQGLESNNPWESYANSAEGDDGELLSGWLLKNSARPARVPEQHSETPYLTQRGIEFIEQAGDQPWLCHLSYIKPHWPYIVPPPYYDMYKKSDIIPPVRSENEKSEDAHPVFRAFQKHRVSEAFSKTKVRETVVPAYMGLIKQLDDQMGVLFEYLEKKNLFENTMIVFSSDHGDYLGDHWMGEKDLFHDPSARIPLIVYDPRKEADKTRNKSTKALVEGIDLAATFIDFFEGESLPHILEGRSLTPLLNGDDSTRWRRYAISEYDYSTRNARITLDVNQADARLIMIRDERWKYIHAEGFRPMLFDMKNDPDELNDLGANPKFKEIRARLHEAIFTWSREHHARITKSPTEVDKVTGKEPPGILIGYWDEKEAQEAGVWPPD